MAGKKSTSTQKKADHKRFLRIKRKTANYRPVCERILDYKDVVAPRDDVISQSQAARCMDCGTPFCHWGCPVGNLIPEWNNAMHAGNWKKAFDLLQSTNNLPEITGRICPATCESACVLGINDDPITIRENELAIVEHAFKKGYVKPVIPKKRTAKKVAIIGSGPAGLACAAQLNQAGHAVTVFERDAKVGGILRYGIPDFKLEKWVIDRRVSILKKEGIFFKTNCEVGTHITVAQLKKNYDALCLTGGSRIPRELKIPGRSLNGIHFAMDYLTQANKKVAKENVKRSEFINAKGKKVVVIGGGDTGSDCVGTANRQGAACVTQIELLPKPSDCRTDVFPWPQFPLLLKTTSSHTEGSDRHWAILTKSFSGKNNNVKKINCIRLNFNEKDDSGCPIMREIPDTEFDIEADLIILAIGFAHPEQALIKKLDIKLDNRGNVKTNSECKSSHKGIYSAGDMRRGQSLVVWAISEGRKAARSIDQYLMGSSNLPTM